MVNTSNLLINIMTNVLVLNGRMLRLSFQKGTNNMIIYDIKKPDFCFTDDRGSLTQLVHEGYSQINVLETKKGVLRGGHFHKIANEAFYVVSGSVAVTLKTKDAKETAVFKKGDFFGIRPYTIHSLFFPEDCVMVAMYDVCVENEDGTKDIYPGEID